MRAEFINPVIVATVHVVRVMCGLQLWRRDLMRLRRTAGRDDVIGVIGLSGRATGTVALALSESVAGHLTARFLQTPGEPPAEDIDDCVAEMVNMVAGNAKADLAAYELQLALPTIVRGSGVRLGFPEGSRAVRVVFDSEVGQVSLLAGFSDNTASERPKPQMQKAAGPA